MGIWLNERSMPKNTGGRRCFQTFEAALFKAVQKGSGLRRENAERRKGLAWKAGSGGRGFSQADESHLVESIDSGQEYGECENLLGGEGARLRKW